MTEIPLPPDGYSGAEPEKKGGFCKSVVVIAIILIIIIGGIAGYSGLSNRSTEGEIDWGFRTIADYNNQDIQTYDDGYYYSDEFTVSAAETETYQLPNIRFEISVDDMGADTGTVWIHIAVYQTAVNVVDNADTWSELDKYLVASDDYVGTADAYAELEDYSDTYTWVVWFEYAGKTSTWDVDLVITLEYAYYV